MFTISLLIAMVSDLRNKAVLLAILIVLSRADMVVDLPSL